MATLDAKLLSVHPQDVLLYVSLSLPTAFVPHTLVKSPILLTGCLSCEIEPKRLESLIVCKYGQEETGEDRKKQPPPVEVLYLHHLESNCDRSMVRSTKGASLPFP